jgi:hypothetical protein
VEEEVVVEWTSMGTERVTDGDGGDKPVDYDEMEMAPPTSFGGKGGKGGR